MFIFLWIISFFNFFLYIFSLIACGKLRKNWKITIYKRRQEYKLKISKINVFNHFNISWFSNNSSQIFKRFHVLIIFKRIRQCFNKSYVFVSFLKYNEQTFEILERSHTLLFQPINYLRCLFDRHHKEISFTYSSPSWTSSYHLLQFMIWTHCWDYDYKSISIEPCIYSSSLRSGK